MPPGKSTDEAEVNGEIRRYIITSSGLNLVQMIHCESQVFIPKTKTVSIKC